VTVWKPIPFSPARKAEMRAYAMRHYGIDRWRLERPRVIVEHLTVSDTFASAYNTFAPDVADSELHELPGICAHFVVDRDGTIYQLVSLTVMCRHTVGLNWTAIGIEHVGRSDAEILRNRRQMASSLALSAWLMQHYRIGLGDVIGHNESLTSRYHRERYRAWRCQTHGDWARGNMDVYRRRLRALALRLGVPAGGAVRHVRPRC
jgi:beta-N-acetylhexosaminidase